MPTRRGNSNHGTMDPTTTSSSSPAEDSITNLLTTYNELNSPSIDILTEEPSALEFMRYVSLNRPFVVRKGASNWKATRTWNIATLKNLLEGASVNVAVTPFGNADSATINPKDGSTLFVKPHEEQQDFGHFVDYVSEQERRGSMMGEVRYAQTQNDNLRNEYETLFSDVQKDIPWARIALQQAPEAINLWIGNSRSVTSLHKDNYENVYVQIIGQKHFVLLPPLCYPCVDEKPLRPASYVRTGEGGGLEVLPEEGEDVVWACWDPDAGVDVHADVNAKEGGIRRGKGYESLARPMRVTLEKGDMLYLPRLWYHKVSQSCSEEGICCAVNYWHDMEFGGSFYPLCQFVRKVALAGTAAAEA